MLEPKKKVVYSSCCGSTGNVSMKKMKTEKWKTNISL